MKFLESTAELFDQQTIFLAKVTFAVAQKRAVV